MNGAAVLISTRHTSKATQRCYRCTPPFDGHEYVVVSAAGMQYRQETYIFPANKYGHVTDCLELKGSFKGALDHERALLNAGYEVAV